MNAKKPQILCAVRGRPGSQSTADRATELAVEQDASLTFLLVIDAQFMSRASHSMSPLRIVYDQLEAMGDFAMGMLADRARARGAGLVDYVIRRGRIAEEILGAVDELRPDTLVLGRPVEPSDQARFGQQEFDHFVGELEGSSKVRIEVVEAPDPATGHRTTTAGE